MVGAVTNTPLKCQSDRAMSVLKVHVDPRLTLNKTKVLPWVSECPGAAITNGHKVGAGNA